MKTITRTLSVFAMLLALSRRYGFRSRQDRHAHLGNVRRR